MGVLKGNSGRGPSGCVFEMIESGAQGLKGINGCGPVGIYVLETIVECWPAELAIGVVWKGTVGVVLRDHWVQFSGKPQIW